MIFYFTATGNCLHAARVLAQREGGTEPVSIPCAMAQEGPLEYEDDAIGIVYPIYGHMMPTMVRRFINRARFRTPYLYFICTYGNRHANAVELCQQEARAAGLEPAYIRTLLMVDNWLPNFDMDEQRALEPAKRIDENLERIVRDVANRERWIEPVSDEDRAAHRQFLSRGLSFEAKDLAGFLTVDDRACTGCGLCSQVCPAKSMTLIQGIAHYDALSGSGCNACLACMHACPAHAIGCSAGDKNPRARFRNEHVSLKDIIAANSGR